MKRIYVKTNPRSARNKVEKISDHEYRVKVTAPPFDGKANLMLLEALTEYFNIPKKSFKIVGGKTARIKMVEIG